MNKSYSSFSFEQIRFLVQDLQRHIIGHRVRECEASDASRFTLILKGESEIERLFFCLDKPFLRFHLTCLKRNTNFTHPLATSLTDSYLTSIKVIDNDRIVFFEFEKNKKKLFLVLEFFPRHPNYYLIDENNRILCSLHPIKTSHYSTPTTPPSRPEATTLLSHGEVEHACMQLEKEYFFEQDKKAIHTCIHKKLLQSLKRQKQLEEELQKSLDWETLQHEGELLKAQCGLLKKGLKDIQVWDWLSEKNVQLTLDPSLSPQDQIKKLFRKCKKMRAGIVHIQEQQMKNNQLIETLQTDLNHVEKIVDSNELIEEKNKWIRPIQEQIKARKEAKSLPYHAFQSSSGVKIWVGKSAKDNEQLTFSLAKGLDWWLHASECAGSHVVIKTHRGEEPDPETLADALQLALYYSKAKQQGAAEIRMTQKKFVSRFGKGQIGKVQISHSKTFFIKIDPERYRSIKERSLSAIPTEK